MQDLQQVYSKWGKYSHSIIHSSLQTYAYTLLSQINNSQEMKKMCADLSVFLHAYAGYLSATPGMRLCRSKVLSGIPCLLLPMTGLIIYILHSESTDLSLLQPYYIQICTAVVPHIRVISHPFNVYSIKEALLPFYLANSTIRFSTLLPVLATNNKYSISTWEVEHHGYLCHP